MVMEKGCLPLGMEDGTSDVEQLLVEPQAVHVSMDSICCFEEKISDNAMYMEDFSDDFGRLRTCTGQQGKDIHTARVLDVIPSEIEVGYFQVQNDFCSMGEDYLLGVELSGSITNLDCGSILHSSVSDCPTLSSSATTNTPWEPDQSRIMEAPECKSIHSDKECSALVGKSLKLPSLSTSRNLGNFYDFASCSFQDVLSNEIYVNQSPLGEMRNSFKNENDKDYAMMRQGVETIRFQGDDSSSIISAQPNGTETFPMQKRSRKPTQRYIDEVTDTVSRFSKKRRKVSSSTSEKCVGVSGNKKCHTESGAMRLPEDETSIIAIQVPFGSIVHKEFPETDACNIEHNLESESWITSGTPQNKKKVDEMDITAAHTKTMKGCDKATNHKKRNDFMDDHHSKNRTVTATRLKKSDNWVIGVSPKKWDNCVTLVNHKKDDSQMSVCRKKNIDYRLSESQEEASGRRKHHRLWTISEVRKLIDGVSQFGVGSWSRIKKLFFPTSAHRTSVDLKDKWRNLLKASGIQDQSNRQGEKKRNVPWRPLPKSILRHVRELAAMYPYPKDRKPKILHIRHDDTPV